MMTTDERWQDFLHRAKERAAMMENAAPLASDRPRRKRATGTPEPGDVSTWFEPERLGKVVIQDPPNIIESTNWFTVKLAGYIKGKAA